MKEREDETGRGKWAGGDGGWKWGWVGASKDRPPALCLRFPSVGKRVATYRETLIDACARVLMNIIIMRA